MKKLLLVLITLFTLQGYGQCWKQIEFGGGHTIAVKDNGTLWAWGSNTSGELGDGTTINKSVPVQIGTDTNWTMISTNHASNIALKADGTIWAWGDNFYGAITGGSDPQTTPLQIGTDTDWKAIATGGNHMLAIKNNGTLWVWGGNDFGCLGLGNTTTIVTPTQLGTATDWVFISAGSHTSFAIKANGTLWAWGSDQDGAMGNGTTVVNDVGGPNVLVPTQVGADSNWKAVDAGGQHVLAQKTNNTLWSWGINAFGELGDNTVVARSFPLQIGTDEWTSFSAGNGSCAGTKTDGKLYTWGINYMYIGVYQPTAVSSDTDWERTLTSGQSYYCALKDNNEIYMWGGNNASQLGLGDAVAHPQPSLFDDTCKITAGLNGNTLTQISLYPNPTSSTLTLANAENLTIENLKITDMTGKIVLSQKGNTAQINVEKLPAGMYFLKVSATEGVQNLKFIKE